MPPESCRGQASGEVGQSDPVERRLGERRDARACGRATQAESDIVAHAQPRHQPRFLEDEAEFRAGAGHRLAVEPDLAGGGALECRRRCAAACSCRQPLVPRIATISPALDGKVDAVERRRRCQTAWRER